MNLDQASRMRPDLRVTNVASLLRALPGPGSSWRVTVLGIDGLGIGVTIQGREEEVYMNQKPTPTPLSPRQLELFDREGYLVVDDIFTGEDLQPVIEELTAEVDQRAKE